MPLVEVTLTQGRSAAQLRSLIHELHEAVVRAVDAPPTLSGYAPRRLDAVPHPATWPDPVIHKRQPDPAPGHLAGRRRRASAAC